MKYTCIKMEDTVLQGRTHPATHRKIQEDLILSSTALRTSNQYMKAVSFLRIKYSKIPNH